MAKTEFLQIRLTPGDRERLARAAAAEHLDVSTWARQTLLRALDRHEARAFEALPPSGADEGAQ